MLLLAEAVAALSAATTAATTAATAGAVAANDYLRSPSPLADQIGAAAISAWVLQKLKSSNLPGLSWINQHSTTVNRAISVLFAIASTSGIHAFWHGSGESIASGGTFTLALADGWITELRSAIWKTSQSFIMQQMVYQGLLKHEAGKKAADVVADTVAQHKEEIAAVVEAKEAQQDPASILRLRGQVQAPSLGSKTKDDWNWPSPKPQPPSSSGKP